MIGQGIPSIRQGAQTHLASAEYSRHRSRSDTFAPMILQDQNADVTSGTENDAEAAKFPPADDPSVLGVFPNASLLCIESDIPSRAASSVARPVPATGGSADQMGRTFPQTHGDAPTGSPGAAHAGIELTLPSSQLRLFAVDAGTRYDRLGNPDSAVEGTVSLPASLEIIVQGERSPSVLAVAVGSGDGSAKRPVERRGQQDHKPMPGYLPLVPQPELFSPPLPAQADAARQVLDQLQKSVADLISERPSAVEKEKLKYLRITLKPEHLGSIHISLRLRGGDLAIAMEAEVPHTARLLQQDQGLLEGLIRQVSSGGTVPVLTIAVREPGPDMGEQSQFSQRTFDLTDHRPSTGEDSQTGDGRRPQPLDKADSATPADGRTVAHAGTISAHTCHSGIIL